MNPVLRKPHIVANWKMQGSLQSIRELILDLSGKLPNFQDIKIVLCPPALYLQEVANILQTLEEPRRFSLGAQNVYCESKGAFTGEISPEMLMDLRCEYVIIGHSERRRLFGETDALIARKWLAAYHAGLIPILCIGETEEERDAGKTFEVLRRQLEVVLEHAPTHALGKGIIAYEPVWAIGTGVTARPDQAEAVHSYLRNWLKSQDPGIEKNMPLLYGGSVKANTVDGLFAVPDIDGALVGGASWIPEEFLTICRNAIARV